MRFLVVGAGATGGYFGGRLLEAGCDVTFLARPARAAQLAATGLAITSPAGDASLPPPPTVLATDLRDPFDVVILTCKAYDLDAAVESVAPAVGPDTAVLPLLNGMRHLDVLDARFDPGRILGGSCFISARLDDAGRVGHVSDIHRLVFGERTGKFSPRIAAIARAIAGVKFEADASDRMVLEMWEKWVFLAALAGITCLTRSAVGDVVAAGGADLAAALLEECRSVAAAAGYPPRPESMQAALGRLTDARSTMMASMLGDLERRGRTEADHILGDLLRRRGAWRTATVHSSAWPTSPSRPRKPGWYASRQGRGGEADATMKILVTGSAGHLGEGLVRILRDSGHEVVGLDVLESPFTTVVGSITDRRLAGRCMTGVRTVFHAAALHKPHVATHGRQEFVDVNVTGTLNLLEEAAAAGGGSFVFTSTTSVFGDALVPPAGAPAAWVTEDVVPVPKNIYGVTKAAAEDLCQLFHRNHGLACLVLRASRFSPEADDDRGVREAYEDGNVKADEYLSRRVEIRDVVDAHLLASGRAPAIGFRKYIVSATTPFLLEDLPELRVDAPRVVRRRVPGYEAEYGRRGWRMFPSIGRVYVNWRARDELGWRPRYDFEFVLDRLRAGDDPRSRLARAIGSKGYHAGAFPDGPCPVE